MRKTFETSDGATLSYVDEGRGDPLILLHGWSQSGVMFRHQVAHFGGRRRVLALDFRGHGASPDTAHGYRIHRFAQDFREVMAHERIERASVIGWSMGASVLWAFIDLFGTAQLDRLVLVDEPASVMRQPGMSDAEAADAGALFDAAAMTAIAAQIVGPEGLAVREAFLASMVTKGILQDLRAALLAENLRADAKCIAALFVNHCAIDWSEIFDRIDRPTLVIGGTVSHVSPRSQAWIHRQVKGSRLVVFEEHEGGAHFPFIEAPARFNAVVSDFLDQPS